MSECEMESLALCTGAADFTIETEHGTHVDVCEQCILNYTGEINFTVID